VLVDPERLPTEQEPRLRGFIADYGAICGGLIVRVIGHRGADEPAGASLNRAQTVHRALVAGGIPPACAELDDAATTDPIAREDDPRKLNRRVDLQLWHE
jgi:flagellar motor protein MotB